MSLFKDYNSELLNKNIVETEIGFATYSEVDGGLWIENIYVAKDFRKSGEASRMADEIAEIAKKKGFKKLFGSVTPTANASTASLKVLLAYGFKLNSSTNNFIWLEKEI
jgi:L-amino acid N-acyltransferase YncA